MKLQSAQSLLLLIDLQARLAPAIDGIEGVLERVKLLIAAARALQVPILASEQNPEGLGHTVPEIADLLSPEEIVAKIHFGLMAEPGFADRLTATGRTQIVVAGTETHVCVLQSLMGLREAGLRPVAVADAVSSRRPLDRQTALARLAALEIPAVTSEMVVFEWLERSDVPAFKQLLPLIR
ncbi:MAG: isochorismatase family protein [Pseudomonadota bacterium]